MLMSTVYFVDAIGGTIQVSKALAIDCFASVCMHTEKV